MGYGNSDFLEMQLFCHLCLTHLVEQCFQLICRNKATWFFWSMTFAIISFQSMTISGQWKEDLDIDWNKLDSLKILLTFPLICGILFLQIKQCSHLKL